ncbi:MAG TPA: GNAT family N-acetyltransferase [Pyrinomonadaceae bacterium]|jgi:Predicted acetyltransferase|nr:GNAT family N-acetyltransferase [Pyrinomonadaceae bacterium]
MQATEQIEIRLLGESDIPAAMQLKEAAGWNQTEEDWRRLLMLESDGCFGAVTDGSLVGTTTTTTYDKNLGWIGMVLVQPQNRRLGIATTLMRTALNYLNGRVSTIKLDATYAGKPVYEQFGFHVESLIERWIGMSKSQTCEPQIKAIDCDTRRELLELDRRAFNADRTKLINSLIDEASVSPVIRRTSDGVLSGYALARRGTKADYVGPLVTMEREQMEPLLDQMLEQLNGRRVYIDFNKECNISSSVLSDRGFVKERDLVRMCYGLRSKVTSPFVVGIAGPEVG